VSDDGVTDASAEKVTEEYFSFAMGEFTAEFPRDRLYATNHMWASEIAEGVWRFGLTAYAVRLLQDVYFLDWEVEPPDAIGLRAQVGSIESKKAESDLYSPVAGSLSRINELTLDDPSLINAATYGDGWLIEMATTDVDRLLDPDAYAQHLVDAWQVAQRTIKGQANH
jgi:glycine cleavage system H protein|tara:strand:- start:2206 stop:2709 length:504 start_codon:yes stop_codon:yes gene_type:complete